MPSDQSATEATPRYLRLFGRVMLVQLVTLALLWLLQSSFGRP